MSDIDGDSGFDGGGYDVDDWMRLRPFAGALATLDDVQRRAAIFALGDTQGGRPIEMEMPQGGPAVIDKDAAIPVLNARTLARSAAFGGAGGGAMELRFMAANADVQVGDELSTSGVDGVYPPGLPVAKVTAVERRAESGFARILLAPSASADGVRHVLVLEPLALQQPPREAVVPDKSERTADRPGDRPGERPNDRPGRGARR